MGGIWILGQQKRELCELVLARDRVAVEVVPCLVTDPFCAVNLCAEFVFESEGLDWPHAQGSIRAFAPGWPHLCRVVG